MPVLGKDSAVYQVEVIASATRKSTQELQHAGCRADGRAAKSEMTASVNKRQYTSSYETCSSPPSRRGAALREMYDPGIGARLKGDTVVLGFILVIIISLFSLPSASI